MAGETITGGAVEEFLNEPGILVDTLTEVGKVGNWVQAIGILVILWIGFQIVNFIINHKKRKHIKLLRGDIHRLEEKIDKLVKSKKRK